MVRATAWLLILAEVFCGYEYFKYFETCCHTLNGGPFTFLEIVQIAFTFAFTLYMWMLLCGIAAPRNNFHLRLHNGDLFTLVAISLSSGGNSLLLNWVEKGRLQYSPWIVVTEVVLRIVIPLYLIVYAVLQRRGWVK